MSKYSRYNSIVNRNSDENMSEDHWLKQFEKTLKKDAVQPVNQQSFYDQINSILGGTKSKYSSVADAVEDMKERSGLSAYLNKIKTAMEFAYEDGYLDDDVDTNKIEGISAKVNDILTRLKDAAKVKDWRNFGAIMAEFDSSEEYKHNSRINAAESIRSIKYFKDPELAAIVVPMDKWEDFTMGYVDELDLSKEEKEKDFKFTRDVINSIKERRKTAFDNQNAIDKKIPIEGNPKVVIPIVIQKCPHIKNTLENFISATRGNSSIPAIIDKIKSIYKSDVSNAEDFDSNDFMRYVSNLNLMEKTKNPSTYENNHNLGKLDDLNDSDIDPSNTDAFNSLNPAKSMNYIIDYLIYKYAGILEDLQEKYPNIKDKLSEYQNKVEKKYFRWLAARLQARFDNLESFNDQDILSTLSLFDKYKGNKPIQSDLYNYLTFKEVENDIKDYLKVKNEKPLSKNTGTLTKIYQDKDYTLVRPDDKQACMAFNKDTKWCITSASSLYYEDYSSSNIVFYFLLTNLKHPYAKIAFSVQRDLSNNISKIQIWDSEDNELSDLLGILPDEDYMKILDIVESNAVIAPEGIVVKIKNGTAELSDVIKYIEFLKNNNVNIIDFITDSVNRKYYEDLRKFNIKFPYYNDKGELHRKDGPAIEYSNGTKEWFLNGELHREDGPAVEYFDGTKYWYLDGLLHREDGPAIEWANGHKAWYLNGKRHREDGPAIEWSDGSKSWFYSDKQIHCKDNQEFLKIINDKNFYKIWRSL